MPASRGSVTPVLQLYAGVTRCLAPVAARVVARKLREQGVPEARVRERMGHATAPRPEGPLIWFHAASVGESLSVLTLITRLVDALPELHVLITTGTATSAALVAKRRPPRTLHQFAPLDTPAAIRRFYDHWQPQAGVFVESELWPGLLIEGQKRGVRLALLNARLSERSVRGWQRWPRTAARVMDTFDVLISQNAANAQNLIAIGADPDRVKKGSNLKAMSAPLPVDNAALREVQTALGDRPLWVASSTHPGEEEIVLRAHHLAMATRPELCLLLIPRHPERGDAVAALIEASGLRMARRTLAQPISPDTQVYLADTLGETGTWYTASPLVLVGGSFVPIGGHNPYEPAQAGAAVLTGPQRANFAETYAPLIASGGAKEVADAEALAAAVQDWTANPGALATARAAAKAFVRGNDAALDELMRLLIQKLGLAG